MSALVLQQRKSQKVPLSGAQRTFNKLLKKVEELQEVLVDGQKCLDEALSFYHHEFAPVEKLTISRLCTYIKLLYGHYKNLRDLSRKEREQLEEFLCYRIDDVIEDAYFNNGDPEICAIYTDLHGADYRETVDEGLDETKKFIQEMCASEGADIDLSHITADDDPEEAVRKFVFAMKDVAEKMQEQESKPKPKTKRQLEKEKKAEELENIQKKGLGSIYKQLAKALHPDLEQDPVEKAEKEIMMKKLTAAYENEDLHTLLSLEVEWMNRSGDPENKASAKSDHQLKIYNSILRDQIQMLDESIQMLMLHPKYFPIQHFCESPVPPIFVMRMGIMEEEQEAKEYEELAQELQTNKAAKVIRKLIKDFSQEFLF